MYGERIRGRRIFGSRVTGVRVGVPRNYEIMRIFENGEAGTFSDIRTYATTYFSDAGTTPATIGDPIYQINDQSGNGIDWTQGTLTARPVLSARYNLLESTDDLTAWSTENTTVTDNGDGSFTVTDDAVSGYHSIYFYRNVFPASSESKNIAVEVKGGTARYVALAAVSSGAFSSSLNTVLFDTQTGQYTVPLPSQYDALLTPVDQGDGWWLIGFQHTSSSNSYARLVVGLSSGGSSYVEASYSGSGDTILVRRPDARWTADTDQPAYQRVGDISADPGDYDTVGFDKYLAFDLGDDALSCTLAAGTYTVVLPTREGIFFDEVAHAGGTFTLGPTSYTGGPDGILEALATGSECRMIGPVQLVNRAFSAAEQSADVQWLQNRGAGVEVYGEIIDLFLIAGQSNAEGRGDSSISPDATLSGYYYDAGFTALADPVGGALTGSMWPSFSNKWFEETGRKCCFVETAESGAPLIPDSAGKNWSPSGTLRSAAVSSGQSARSAIQGRVGAITGSTYVVWAQGESEAQDINGTTITGAIYEQALEDIAAYFALELDGFEAMGVVRTGNRTPRTDDSDWAEIRQAQESASADSANLRMLYRGTASFPAEGMGLMGDSLHYSQQGLDIAGRCSALELSKPSETPVPDAPELLAFAAFPDTSDAAETVLTKSHSTHADTKMIVVAAHFARITTNTTVFIQSCSFGGAPMTKAYDAYGGNGSIPGRTGVAVFYLTETEYGDALGSATEDVVLTNGAAANILQMAVFDIDAEGIPDNCANGIIAGGATGNNVALEYSTGAPGFVVAVAGSCADSASALTSTIAGVTEIMDAGASNGSRSGQCCIGYRSVTETVGIDSSLSISGEASSAALLAVSFRGVIDGEVYA